MEVDTTSGLVVEFTKQGLDLQNAWNNPHPAAPDHICANCGQPDPHRTHIWQSPHATLSFYLCKSEETQPC